MKNTKNSEQNKDVAIAKALADEIYAYASQKGFQNDIEFSVYKDKTDYRIKIIHDHEGILQEYLDKGE